jgi:hypothetical protein
MSNEVVPFEQMSTMAMIVAKSKMFPGFDTQEQAMALMLVCQEDGIGPMQAMRRYHIVKGRPAWKSQALAAEFMRLGGKLFYRQSDSKVCIIDGEFKGEKYSVEWTIEEARTAGLTEKDVWKYPRQMLRARATAELVNVLAPGISAGIYTVEEVQDMDDTPDTKKVKVDVNEERVTEINALIESCTDQEAIDQIIRVSHKLIIESMPARYKKRIQEKYLEKVAEFAGPAPTQPSQPSVTDAVMQTIKDDSVAAVPSEPVPGPEVLQKRLAEEDERQAKIADSIRSENLVPLSNHQDPKDDGKNPPETPSTLHRRPLPDIKTPEASTPSAEIKKEAVKATYAAGESYPEWIRKGALCDYSIRPGGSPVLIGCIIEDEPHVLNGQMVVKLSKSMNPVPISCLTLVKGGK